MKTTENPAYSEGASILSALLENDPSLPDTGDKDDEQPISDENIKDMLEESDKTGIGSLTTFEVTARNTVRIGILTNGANIYARGGVVAAYGELEADEFFKDVSKMYKATQLRKIISELKEAIAEAGEAE